MDCYSTMIGFSVNRTEFFFLRMNFSVCNGISNMNFFMTSSLNNFCGKIASLSWKESSGGDLLPLSISIEIAWIRSSPLPRVSEYSGLWPLYFGSNHFSDIHSFVWFGCRSVRRSINSFFLAYLVGSRCLTGVVGKWIDGPTNAELWPSSADRSPSVDTRAGRRTSDDAWIEELLHTAAGSRLPRTYAPTDYKPGRTDKKGLISIFVLDFRRELKRNDGLLMKGFVGFECFIDPTRCCFKDFWMTLSYLFFDFFRVNFLI